MDISYDPAKNEELIRRRGIGFGEIKNIFLQPYYEEPRGGYYPGQTMAIGYYNRKLWTLIYEEIEDDIGQLRWLVTFWPSTTIEKRKYRNA